ncbi:Glycoside hydrolase family 22 [Trinorchestia longiramus]|nr:Glycoside hydrolase family 22 [Trinorchestia longiramus]
MLLGQILFQTLIRFLCRVILALQPSLCHSRCCCRLSSYIKMRLTTSTFLLVWVLLAATSHARVYTRCQLARAFKCTYRIPTSKLADWVCLVKSESNYNTAAMNTNRNGSKDYGLFQINDYFWCKSSSGSNGCGIACSKLRDNNISDDVKCAKKIYSRQGFNACTTASLLLTAQHCAHHTQHSTVRTTHSTALCTPRTAQHCAHHTQHSTVHTTHSTALCAPLTAQHCAHHAQHSTVLFAQSKRPAYSTSYNDDAHLHCFESN